LHQTRRRRRRRRRKRRRRRRVLSHLINIIGVTDVRNLISVVSHLLGHCSFNITCTICRVLSKDLFTFYPVCAFSYP
jgi:hypothetical protein